MAITSLDGALAGMQPIVGWAKGATGTMSAGRPWSMWSLGGNPGAGSFDSTLNGVTLSSTSSQVAGQLRHVNPGSGNAYLAGFSAISTQAGLLMLCDRIWHNGGFTITSTSAQNITSPTWPARDNSGSTNGDGVILGMEISSTVGAATPTITVAYTNQDGTGSRSATNSFAAASGAAACSFFPIGLQAGDTGVRSVQSVTLNASWVSGTMNLVAYRVLATVPLSGTYVPNGVDSLTGGFSRIYDGAVPFLIFIPSTTTNSNLSGTYQETHG